MRVTILNANQVSIFLFSSFSSSPCVCVCVCYKPLCFHVVNKIIFIIYLLGSKVKITLINLPLVLVVDGVVTVFWFFVSAARQSNTAYC